MAKKKRSRANKGESEASPGPPASLDAENIAAAFARLHVWQIQAVRDLLVVAAVITLVWVGYALRAVTVPLLVALLLAYLFEPAIARLSERPRVKRSYAVLGLLGVVVIGTVVLFSILTPLVVGQTTRFVNDIQSGSIRGKVEQLAASMPGSIRDELEPLLQTLPGPLVPREIAEAPTDDENQAGPETATDASEDETLSEARVRELINAEFDRRALATEQKTEERNWLGLARGSATAIARVLGAIVQIGLLSFLIPFYFFFFSLWYPDVIVFSRTLLPEEGNERTYELLTKMDRVVSGFVRGRIVISLIMGVMLAIGWWICGVPYAVALGLVIGVFCAVPYLGGIGVPIAVGLLLVDQYGAPGNTDTWWLWAILWPSVVFAIVQLIEGYVLTPMIAGKVTNLDPVTILVAVLAGGSVLGVYGMLLAIPATACGKILLTDVLMPRVRAWTRGELRDPLPIENVGTSKRRNVENSD